MTRVLLLVCLLAACGGPARGPEGPAARGAGVAGLVPLLDGGELELASLRGQPLVVHFFTTWSLPSQADVEELLATREQLGRDHVHILGIALDPEGYKLVSPWRAGAGADYTIALATPEILAGQSPFGDVLAAVPSTVLVDAGGSVAWSHYGPLAKGELARRIKALR
jgi:hypothetical protein